MIICYICLKEITDLTYTKTSIIARHETRTVHLLCLPEAEGAVSDLVAPDSPGQGKGHSDAP